MLEHYFSILNLKVVKAWQIVHRDAISSQVFSLVLQDQSLAILKIFYSKPRWQREQHFLKAVAHIIAAPAILAAAAQGDGFAPALLLQNLEGRVISSLELSNRQAFIMGKTLALIHQVSAPYYGDIASGERLPMNVKSAISLLERNFLEGISECKDHIESSLIDQSQRYFYDRINGIDELDGPCISHRDYRPGNVMFEGDILRGVIDWENARYGFAEEDFAQMQYLCWEQNQASKQAFLEGYAAVRCLPDFEAVLPLLRLCKAIGAIGFACCRQIYPRIIEQNLQWLKAFLN